VTTTLEGRGAIVTGGASGIGRAIAIAFASEGCHVCIVDRASPERIDQVVSAVMARGGKAFAAQADISVESEVTTAIATARERLPAIDILVNNAGVTLEKSLFDTTIDDFDRVIGVNLRGTFMVGRAVLRAMVDRGSGRVINLASELAYLGRENHSAYCASKGGVISMTRSWAREFAPTILVNAIAPGPTDTAMLGPEFTSAETFRKESQNPLGRIGRPEEIAATAVFLAGPGATFMTGQCISPNGGAVMF
jgi:3-oxoacyl-[acyl-carrier protein] reductase